jgi:hypothetical protein
VNSRALRKGQKKGYEIRDEHMDLMEFKRRKAGVEGKMLADQAELIG